MTEVRVLIITPDGHGEGKLVSPDLASLKEIVGGWLECVTLPTCHLYCNEEGKLMGLPPNILATQLAHRLGWQRGDLLCGTVVFLGGDGSREADLPQSVFDTLIQTMRELSGQQ